MGLGSYILSFTGASLSMSESIKIAEAFLRLRDWTAVKNEVKKENLIQARTKTSLDRVYQELYPRLMQLSEDQLELLVEGNPQEQKQILWYAICNRYAYIRDFAEEVVREKFLKMDFQLTEFDYDAFYNRKADWHLELDELTDTSRQKIKVRMFRMMVEAEITTPQYRIIPATFSNRFKEVFATDIIICNHIFPVASL